MPRRRVPPDQRQRSSKACEACRATKKRCNDQAPCSNCLRRGLASSCTNLESNAHMPGGSVLADSSPRQALHIVTPESVIQCGDAAAGPAYRRGSQGYERGEERVKRKRQFEESRLRSQQSTRPASPAGDDADAEEAEHPRILLSARGEKGQFSTAPVMRLGSKLTAFISLRWQLSSHFVSAVPSPITSSLWWPVGIH